MNTLIECSNNNRSHRLLVLSHEKDVLGLVRGVALSNGFIGTGTLMYKICGVLCKHGIEANLTLEQANDLKTEFYINLSVFPTVVMGYKLAKSGSYEQFYPPVKKALVVQTRKTSSLRPGSLYKVSGLAGLVRVRSVDKNLVKATWQGKECYFKRNMIKLATKEEVAKYLEGK